MRRSLGRQVPSCSLGRALLSHGSAERSGYHAAIRIRTVLGVGVPDVFIWAGNPRRLGGSENRVQLPRSSAADLLPADHTGLAFRYR
jgi:hypothetical protein